MWCFASEVDLGKQASEKFKIKTREDNIDSQMTHKSRPDASDALKQNITPYNTFHVSYIHGLN